MRCESLLQSRYVALVILLGLASACYLNSQPASQPAPQELVETPPPQTRKPVTSVAQLTTPPRQQSLPAATEPGFTYCCGNAEFKLEIECGIRLKRCYTKRPGGSWEHTFGRHCKQELGDACYMSACERRC